jgi:HlyD family secretion protein
MFSKILEHKITLIISVAACVIVAGGSAYLLLSPQKHVLTNATAQVMKIQETVSADGKIDSDQHVSLSFQKGGQVTAVNVKVGDRVYAGQFLASVDSGQLSASLLGAQADVQSAEANVTALQKGATTQTVAVYDQNVSTAQLALSTAVRDAYLKIQDVLLNKINILFQNNSSVNPILNINTGSQQLTIDINNARVSMTDKMSNLNSMLNTSATGDETLTEAATDISAVKAFVNSLASQVNRLSIGSSGMTQAAIDADVAAVNGAATEANAADTEFNAAMQTYKTATDQLNVIQASSTPEALQIAQASLAKAEANVASIQSQIDDTVLKAPFDGIVASVNPKIGDNFPDAKPAIDIVSAGAYKIDVMIPENEVAAVSVGDLANINFYAGNNLTATGTVSSIDLSETVTNGVGAYKATVYLSGSNPLLPGGQASIRTGMSATVIINGASADNVVAIPASAIITRNDGSYALVFNKAANTYAERKIQTGISDGNWTEVRTGLQTGEVVAAFGDNNQ